MNAQRTRVTMSADASPNMSCSKNAARSRGKDAPAKHHRQVLSGGRSGPKTARCIPVAGLRHQAAVLAAATLASAGSTNWLKPTEMRFHPLMMLIINVSLTCSCSVNCACKASRAPSRWCPSESPVSASVRPVDGAAGPRPDGKNLGNGHRNRGDDEACRRTSRDVIATQSPLQLGLATLQRVSTT